MLTCSHGDGTYTVHQLARPGLIPEKISQSLEPANAKIRDVYAEYLGPGMNDHCYRLIIREQSFVKKSNMYLPIEKILLNLKSLLQVTGRPYHCSRHNDLLNAGYTMSIS